MFSDSIIRFDIASLSVSGEGNDLFLREMAGKSRRQSNCSFLIAGIHDLASSLASAKGLNSDWTGLDLSVT